MKKVKASEKFRIMLTICDNEKGGILEKFLSDKGIKCGIIFMGKGTAESDIADLFGFGLSDKLVTATLVPESREREILTGAVDMLGIEKDAYGLALMLDVSSATSVIMDMVGIPYN